jgi:hypothetical protein
MGNNPTNTVDPDGGFTCYLNGKPVKCATVGEDSKFDTNLYDGFDKHHVTFSEFSITLKGVDNYNDINWANQQFSERLAFTNGIRAAQRNAAGVIAEIGFEAVMLAAPELRLFRGSGLMSVGFQRTTFKSAGKGVNNLWKVGEYNEIRGLQSGLDAHHAGQKALMKRFIDDYNIRTGPSILVPKVGHTIRGPNGIVSRSTTGIMNARQLLARDIFELRRVYHNVPNSSLNRLINLNKVKYPSGFIK